MQRSCEVFLSFHLQQKTGTGVGLFNQEGDGNVRRRSYDVDQTSEEKQVVHDHLSPALTFFFTSYTFSRFLQVFKLFMAIITPRNAEVNTEVTKMPS